MKHPFSAIRKALLLAVLFCAGCTKEFSGADDLRCEYSVNPLCMDNPHPRLSWVMCSDVQEDRQTAYRILVASSPELLKEGKADCWDTGKKMGNQTSQIHYEGTPLQSASDYFWKVQLWNKDGQPLPWSKTSKWSTGLFSPKDWQGAKWIAFRDETEWKIRWNAQKAKEKESAAPMTLGGAWPWFNGKDSTIFALKEMGNYDPSPLFRKEFSTRSTSPLGLSKKSKVRKATLYVCGLGYYIPYLNGQRIGDKELNPAWTNFEQHVLYDAYDVTTLIKKENVLGFMLGRGQYEPICNDVWGLSLSAWIDQPKVIALLRMEYHDGTVENVVSDNTWKTAGGPVVYDDTRQGELYDAREEKEGWNSTEYDDSKWAKAHCVEWKAKLEAQTMPPIRKFAPLKPVRQIPDTEHHGMIYDIGKEVAGWARVCLEAPEGTRVLVEYCERPSRKDLCPDLPASCFSIPIPDPFYASFYDKCINVRQQNGYIAKGRGKETFECMFSYKGFRYIRVTANKEVNLLSVEGIPVHTDFEETGSFECSDKVVNTLQQNAINSMNSNFMGIPTDCPHREKQGWTCDTYIVSKAACYNQNMMLFLEKWIGDLAGSKSSIGCRNTVAPSTGYDNNSSTTWPAALVYVPQDLCHFYADTDILQKHLPDMEEFAESSAKVREVPGKKDLIQDVLGDWISPHKTIDDSLPRQNEMAPPEGQTFYGTAAHYRIHQQLADICARLGEEEKSAYYRQRSEEIAERFNTEFLDAESLSYHGTNPTDYRQSTNATALYYGLVPDSLREAVGEELVKQIHRNDDHLATGFLGIQSLMGWLPEKEPELTYKMVVQPTYPSWGYMVEKKATSMWESWDGYDSQNHLPFCMVSEYFYKHLAGIQYDESCPGFKHFFIRPSFISSLSYVRCHYNSMCGRIESNWTRTEKGVELEILVPANTTATVCLPDKTVEVGSGKYHFDVQG